MSRALACALLAIGVLGADIDSVRAAPQHVAVSLSSFTLRMELPEVVLVQRRGGGGGFGGGFRGGGFGGGGGGWRPPPNYGGGSGIRRLPDGGFRRPPSNDNFRPGTAVQGPRPILAPRGQQPANVMMGIPGVVAGAASVVRARPAPPGTAAASPILGRNWLEQRNVLLPVFSRAAAAPGGGGAGGRGGGGGGRAAGASPPGPPGPPFSLTRVFNAAAAPPRLPSGVLSRQFNRASLGVTVALMSGVGSNFVSSLSRTQIPGASNDNRRLMDVFSRHAAAPGATRASLSAAATPLWSTGQHASPAANALAHWNKHRREFPNLNNALEYVRAARSFASQPPAGTLSRQRANGDRLLYNPSSNVFAVIGADGAPRTMFRPTQGMSYWRDLDE